MNDDHLTPETASHAPGSSTGSPVDPGPRPLSGGAHDPPPGAGVMNVLRWVLLAVLVLVAVVSLTTWITSRGPRPETRTVAGEAKYYCPMHPTYTSDRPGECPICGMALEPIPVESGHGTQGSGNGNVPGLTTVHLTPDRIQLIGVRYTRVTLGPPGTAAELVGFVVPDESQLRRVQIRTAGWIEKLHVNRTGEVVRAGQPLVTLYSPELFQSEQEFLIETGVASHAMTGDPGHATEPMQHESAGIGSARERLRLLGVPDAEIARLEREHTASTRLTLTSPVTGTVLERSVTEGQSIGPDTPILTVADLSHVWILADLYEMDLGNVHVGDPARFTADALGDRTFGGRIEFVYPTVSSETRTLKARFAVDNTRGVLRPGMYGRVKITGRGAPMLTVPSEAVVRAGENDYVFLARAGGTFEPRRVTIGPGAGERIVLLNGVAAGDTVVSSASFLIDSESRLKAAIAGMGGTPDEHAHVDAP